MKTSNQKLSPQADYYHAVSLSGGKDSTAMLLLMIERDMPIDLVLSADTGMEFPEMYEHLAKLDEYLFKKRKLHITTLRHPHGSHRTITFHGCYFKFYFLKFSQHC